MPHARNKRHAKAQSHAVPTSDRSGSAGSLLPILVVGLVAVLVVGAVLLLRNPSVAASTVSAKAAPTAAPTVAAPVASNPVPTQPPQPAITRVPVSADEGTVRLAVADFADGKAKYYTYKGPTGTIQFFVLKGSDNVLRAAFDACDVCFPNKLGYHQEGDVMVCNNCGTRFPSVRINIEVGGCNPSPLTREVQGSMLVIKASDIETGSRYF